MDLRAARAATADSDNPRALETRDRLLAAFRELTDAGEAARLTPSAVARHAGVARSSFYAHFADLTALAVSALRADLDGVLARDRDLRAQGRLDDLTVVRRSLADLVEQLGRYLPLAPALPLSASGQAPATLIAEELERSVRATMRARRPDATEDRIALAASVFIGAVLAGYAHVHAAPTRNREALVDELTAWLPPWLFKPDVPGWS